MQRTKEEIAEVMQQFKERMERETRFKTIQEFKAFAANNYCYYPIGFGATIRQLVSTPEQFIEFCLKCGIHEHGDDFFPWFVNSYRHNDPDQPLYFIDTNENDERFTWYSDGEFSGYMPTEVIAHAYCIDYNPYYDEPFCVRRVDDFPVYAPNTFRVNEKILNQLPAIVEYVSVDDFDRCGKVQGENLTIISLKDIEDQVMMFV